MSGPWETGPDGWPISPDHPANRDKRSVEEIREHIFMRDMGNNERAWADGNMKALSKAVILCEKADRPLPAWAVAGVQKILWEHFSGGAGKKRGRLGNAKAAHRQNGVHYQRWAVVVDVRDRWIDIMGLDHKPSLEEAYGLASEMLADSKDAGSEETIKKSYQLVERLSRSGKGWRFYIT